MADRKEIEIDGKKIRCIGYYCYNDHYNTTVFDVTDGAPQYLGEIPDLKVSDSSFHSKVESFVKSTVG